MYVGMKIKGERNYIEGSLTVEIACLMPLILGIPLLLIWLGMYYQNQGVLLARAYRYGIIYIKEKEDIGEQNFLESGLWEVEEIGLSAKKEEKKVIVSYYLKPTNLGFGWVQEVVGKRENYKKDEISYHMIEQEKFIWRWKKMKDFLEHKKE